MATKSTRVIEIPASGHIALDMRSVSTPYCYIVRPGASSTVTRSASCAGRPGNRFVEPDLNADIDADGIFFEDYGVSFIRLDNGGSNAGSFEIFCSSPDSIVEHTNADTLTALAQDALALAVDEAHVIPIEDMFSYEKGGVDATVTSSDATKATAVFNPDTGEVGILGVAAGTTTITVSGRTPGNVTADATIRVTVA